VPRNRAKAYRIVPAVKNRNPAHSHGGISKTAVRMARNVDPHSI
jgi:hypothetical protein